jgi:hypothetical protein
MKNDVWKRPVKEVQPIHTLDNVKQLDLEFTTPYQDVARQPGMIWAPEPCTPEEMDHWRENDYWNKMDFDPMVMFVVIPAVIQIVVFGMMLAVMLLNQLIF